jgi:phosphoenolpyruvate synthase/pyruvate phosphate dikinase
MSSTWRAKLLHTIRKCSDAMETDPVLLVLLMEGLHAWLHNNKTPSPAAYPTTYRQLVREQTTLGWRQLFNGRWSTDWARLHECYILRLFDPIPDNLIATKWMSTFMDAL